VRPSALAAIAALLCAALLVAGCGGEGSGGSNSTAAPAGGGTPNKATAPNAPAGSKVVACEESAEGMEGLRATAVDCGTAERIMRRWAKHRSCTLPDGASRGSCALGGFRCQTVKSGDGEAVSCARPGGDIAFIVHPGRSGG
jgi:hypothetical protein